MVEAGDVPQLAACAFTCASSWARSRQQGSEDLREDVDGLVVVKYILHASAIEELGEVNIAAHRRGPRILDCSTTCQSGLRAAAAPAGNAFGR